MVVADRQPRGDPALETAEVFPHALAERLQRLEAVTRLGGVDADALLPVDMLVLSRHKNESVVIGDDITVTVIESRGDKVRLGFDHPKEVSVHRREVYEAIRGQQPRTAVPPDPSVPVPDSHTQVPMTESHIQVPTPPSSQVTLSDRQIALIDRFRTSIREATGTGPSRDEAIEAMFQAFEKAESNLSLFLCQAIRDRREPWTGRDNEE
jgi:carbon storage regulator